MGVQFSSMQNNVVVPLLLVQVLLQVRLQLASQRQVHGPQRVGALQALRHACRSCGVSNEFEQHCRHWLKEVQHSGFGDSRGC